MHENLACVRELSESGIVVSIGHTNATYVQAREAIETGARNATHLFNAMPPLNHRDPGAVGAALEDDRVYCELIADAFHIHPGLFSILRKLKGDRLVLVTDCTPAGGLAAGEYSPGGQPIPVTGIARRLSDGPTTERPLWPQHAIRNLPHPGRAAVCADANMAARHPAN